MTLLTHVMVAVAVFVNRAYFQVVQCTVRGNDGLVTSGIQEKCKVRHTYIFRVEIPNNCARQ